MRRISDDERRARLARRHRLLPSARLDSVPRIADSVVALHSSDPATVYLSIAARSNTLSTGDIEHALYDERSVVRHHAMRRTLWVTTLDVAESAHAACTRKVAAAERAKTIGFIGDETWLDDAGRRVVDFVRDCEGVSTRAIGDALPDLRRAITYGAGTRHETTGPAHARVVLQAAFDGEIVRGRPAGTWIGSQFDWSHRSRWPDLDWARHDELAGMTEVVRRWLERFGPATLTDLVWWTGSTRTLVRQALAELDTEPVELSVGEGIVLADDPDVDPVDEPWVAVLPGLDPTAMGWKQRAWYLDDVTAARVTDRFGNIGPTVWVDGRIVGGWVQRPGGELALELTGDIGREHRAMLDDELARIAAFIGETRFKVRFPAPNQVDLLA